MAVTRITNNQIEDGTIDASTKVADYSITGGKLANTLTYGSDLTVSGNLTVSGEVTAIDTIDMTVEDPLILLAKEQTGTPALDIGFIGKRGSDTNIAWIWDESDDKFATVFTSDEVTNTTITVSSYASFKTLDAAVTGNLAVTGTSSFTGNVSGDLNVDGTVAAGNITTNGTFTALGNIDGANLNATSGVTAGTTVIATGNVTGGNLTTAGDVTTATVTASGAITSATTITATGNITGGNIESLGAFTANSLESATSITAGTTITATGNITGGNLLTGGDADITGDISAVNAVLSGDVDAATGTITTLDGTLATYTTGNITTVNATTVNTTDVVASGDVDAATGTIATLDGTTADFSGNVDGGNLNSDAGVYATTAITAGTTITATGNITGGNLVTSNDVTTATVTASGDITSGGDVEGATLTTSGLASVGTLNTTGNATIGGNLHVLGNITYINIDDLRVEDPLIILGTGPNGAPLTSDDGKDRGAQMDYYSTSNSQQQSAFQGYDNSAGNMVLASNVTVSGDVVTVVDWGQTEVGGLYAHDAITTDSTITATGNITGGNIATTGAFSANSLESVTSITAGTTITATGNITGGNLLTGGDADITGDISAVNAVFSGDVDAATGTITTLDGTLATYTTGNITTVNATTVNTTDVVASGDVDAATGTIATLDGTTADFSGNVDGGNLNSDAGVYATTVVDAGTSITAGTTITATGNITGGNLITAGAVESASVAATGAITAGTTITATGNVAGGNLTTAGAMDSATLSTTGEATLASAIVSDLTDNRVVIAGTSGALEDDSNFTFDGSTLTVGADAAITGTADVQTALIVGDVAANLTSGATLEVDSTDSMKIPVGTTLERPGSPATGMMRFNTTLDNLEFYDNGQWTTAGTSFTVITANTQSGDGSTVAFTMPETGTTAATIVSINGVVQIPTTAYSVSGNVCTFTEAPLSTDSIDFRQLATTTEVTGLSGGAGQSFQADVTNIEWDIQGNLIPTANVTYDLGSDTLRWNDLYLAGNTISLGSVQLKDTGGTIGFFESDGTTPATIDSASVDTTQIADGSSKMFVVSTAGNIDGNIAGSTVFNLASTGLKVTGSIEATGGFVGLDATAITNGTSDVTVDSSGGPISVDVGGTNIVNFTSAGITNGQADGVGNIGAAGASFNTVHAVATSAQYADLAEMYSADADIEPGTVVMFGGDEEVTTCGDADCKRVAGVVSTNPSYIMNAAHEGDHVVAVALTGRVPTKVVGPVRKGDMMVSAGNGAAKASDDPKLGAVLGKALEDFDGDEGVIEVVVGRM